MKTIFLFLAMVIGTSAVAATEVSYRKDPAQRGLSATEFKHEGTKCTKLSVLREIDRLLSIMSDKQSAENERSEVQPGV